MSGSSRKLWRVKDGPLLGNLKYNRGLSSADYVPAFLFRDVLTATDTSGNHLVWTSAFTGWEYSMTVKDVFDLVMRGGLTSGATADGLWGAYTVGGHYQCVAFCDPQNLRPCFRGLPVLDPWYREVSA